MTEPKTVIHRHSGDALRTRRLGPYEIEEFIRKDEHVRQSVWRVRIAPHQTTAISYHIEAEETYYVLAGRGSAFLDGNRHELRIGDFLRLPPGTRHGFVTEAEALDMLNIHAPGCWPDHDTFFEGNVPEGFGSSVSSPR